MAQALVTNLDVAARLSPGYLMAPFGWAARPLAAIIQAQADLAPYLLTLSRCRMHLIALAFAHGADWTDPSLARRLLGGRSTDVLNSVLGRRPFGLKRALRRLPVKVMKPESYRHLVELLDDRAAAVIIYHVEALEERVIASLHDVPPPLRRTIGLESGEFVLSFEGLTESLRFLVARGAAPSFDALVSDLGSIRRPWQLIARLGDLVRNLPLPDAMPPIQVGAARRLDRSGQIRKFARQWKNCLEMYLVPVDDGQAAIYFWPHPASPALCLLRRHGRLGWALEQVKGPENAELPAARRDEIFDAFAAAGIANSSAIHALKLAAERLDRPRLGRARQHHRDWAVCHEIYEAFDEAA